MDGVFTIVRFPDETKAIQQIYITPLLKINGWISRWIIHMDYPYGFAWIPCGFTWIPYGFYEIYPYGFCEIHMDFCEIQLDFGQNPYGLGSTFFQNTCRFVV